SPSGARGLVLVYAVEDLPRPLKVLLKDASLELGQPLLLQQACGLLCGTRPCWPVSRGDAGIWTKGRLAERGQRAFGSGGLLQAGSRAGIEEAIGQHADI